MLELFAYKKYKKNKAEKEAKQKQEDGNTPKPEPATAGPSSTSAVPVKPEHHAEQIRDDGTPVLDEEDERFLRELTLKTMDEGISSENEGSKPPLPPRIKTPELTWDSDSESFVQPKAKQEQLDQVKGKGKEKEKDNFATVQAARNRLSFLFSRNKGDKATKEGLKPQADSLSPDQPEVDREKNDLSRVLDDLNLSARNNKAFALSAESSQLVQQFTLVLKDLVNGVPTAARDLTSLLDDKDGKLAVNFEKLPKSLKKLVTQLPTKLSSTLAPELLAVAAEAQGLNTQEAAATGGIKGAAKRLLVPKSLSDLATKPGAIVGMLRGIMNALKLRWPAFIGTNVIWSVAVFLLMFVLWYCHKRGREVRLEQEAQGTPIDGSDRIEELPDDPTLPAPPKREEGEASGSQAAATTAPGPNTTLHAERKE